MATVAHGFSGYLQVIFPGLSFTLVIVGFLLFLAVINFWGIKQSSLTNILCTAIEISGLVVVIVAGMQFFGEVDVLAFEPVEQLLPHVALLQGAVLAFYAFIGFEDIINVAEETKDPAKTIPRAIITALLITAVFYILVSIAAVSAVSSAQLAASSAPLMLVVEKGFPAMPRELFTMIALFAVTNTALVNFIMSSRILYGMSREGLVPAALGRVHGKTRTPYIAIAVVLVIAAALALTGGLQVLAQSTSLLLLGVFLLMNLSLIVVKRRASEPKPSFMISIWIPVFGALSCLGLIFFVESRAFITVAVLILIGAVVYLVQKGLER